MLIDHISPSNSTVTTALRGHVASSPWALVALLSSHRGWPDGSYSSICIKRRLIGMLQEDKRERSKKYRKRRKEREDIGKAGDSPSPRVLQVHYESIPEVHSLCALIMDAIMGLLLPAAGAPVRREA